MPLCWVERRARFVALECSVHRRLEHFQVADVPCINIPRRHTKRAVRGDLRWIFWIYTALLTAVDRQAHWWKSPPPPAHVCVCVAGWNTDSVQINASGSWRGSAWHNMLPSRPSVRTLALSVPATNKVLWKSCITPSFGPPKAKWKFHLTFVCLPHCRLTICNNACYGKRHVITVLTGLLQWIMSKKRHSVLS